MRKFKSLMNICRIYNIILCACVRNRTMTEEKKRTSRTETIELEYWIFQSINSRRMCQFRQNIKLILNCCTFNRNFEIFVSSGTCCYCHCCRRRFCCWSPCINKWNSTNQESDGFVCKWAPISRIMYNKMQAVKAAKQNECMNNNKKSGRN